MCMTIFDSVMSVLAYLPFYLFRSGEWEGWARKSLHHTSCLIVGTPSDRPKLVCNRCVVDLFGTYFCVRK